MLASAEAGPPGHVFVWHAASRRRISTANSPQGIAGLLVSPDGRSLAVLGCCTESGQVSTWHWLLSIEPYHSSHSSDHWSTLLQDLSLWLVEDLAMTPDAKPCRTSFLASASLPNHTHICAQWAASGACTIVSTGSQSVAFWDMTNDDRPAPLAVSPAAVSLGQPVTLTVSAFVPDHEDQVTTGDAFLLRAACTALLLVLSNKMVRRQSLAHSREMWCFGNAVTVQVAAGKRLGRCLSTRRA